MTTVVNSVVIAGPIEPIFDLATTARLWPQWHPASKSVGGVTQRPYQLGDVILEHGEVAGVAFRVPWKVTEHRRPTRVVFEAQAPPARITYTFAPKSDGTEFTRQLDYDLAVLRAVFPDAAALQQLMHEQSQIALQCLKDLVESILREEKMLT